MPVEEEMSRSSFFEKVQSDIDSAADFEQLKQTCSKYKDAILNWPIMVETSEPVTLDETAFDQLPAEHAGKFIPASVRGDGNCFFRSLSLLATGTQEHYKEFRARTVIEMVTNEELYTNEDTLKNLSGIDGDILYFLKLFSGVPFDDDLSIKDVYRLEVMHVKRQKQFCGLWEIFPAANALKCKIQSVYPRLGYQMNIAHMNRIISPSGTVLTPEKQAIMWTSARVDKEEDHWVPNHVVPLVPVTPESGNAEDMEPGSADRMEPGSADGMGPGSADGMGPGSADGMEPGSADGMDDDAERLLQNCKKGDWIEVSYCINKCRKVYTGKGEPALDAVGLVRQAWELGFREGTRHPAPKTPLPAFPADNFRRQKNFRMGLDEQTFSMHSAPGLEGGMAFEGGVFSAGSSQSSHRGRRGGAPSVPGMYDQSIQHDQWHMDDQSFRSYDTANYDRENGWGYEAGGGGYRGGAVQRNRGRGQGQGQAVGQGQQRGRGRGQSLWGSQHPAGDQTSGGWGRGISHGRGKGGSFGLQDQGGGFGLQGQGGSFGLQCQGGSFGLQGQGGSFGLQGQGGSFGLQGQGDGFGQQGQGDGFGQQGQKNRVQGRGRGRGQSQSLNNNQSVGFQQMQRGRGRGCYSGGGGGNYSSDYSDYEEQDYTYSSFGQQTAEEAIQNNNQLTNHGQPNQGANRNQNRGRVYVRGRSGGNQRGVGIEKKDIKERTVQAISDKIVVMVREGGSGGRGRGGGRKERGTVKKPTSLMDLVDSASKRKLSHTKHLCLSPQATAFNEFLEFFRTSPDYANDIQTALNASRLSVKIEFEAEQLCFIIKLLFTGVLKVGGFFLTRGLGLSKKAVKHDCFERAVQILRNSSVEDILALEDCGKETLREEVEHQSKDDIETFKTFLSQKQAGEAHTSQKVQTISDKQAGGIVTSRKVRTTQESKLQSVERNLPLADKMKMIQKEMKKSDLGKEDSAMVPRFDVLCSKVGIRVSALYKVVDLEDNRQFNTTPYKGRPDINLICEIYYDDVLVGQGQGHSRREAQIAAYNSIYNCLTKKNVSQIARGPKIPQQPEALYDFFEIVHKGGRQGNNHHRMMSLGSYPPDVKKSMGDMVIIETVGDSIEVNAYKILEYSASRNSMLLEWKQLDTGNNLNGFRCEITVNGQKSVTGTGASKPKARNAAAAMILMDMYMSNDVISNKGVEDPSKAIPVEEITARAQALKLEGPPREERVQNVWPEEEEETDSEETTNPTLPEEEDLVAVKDSEEMADNTQFKEESDAEKDSEETANTIQPEEQSNTDRDSEKTANSNEDRVSQKQKWMSNPLQPWLEDAIVEMIESYAKRLTLEELIIGPGITPELRCFVTTAARHCLLGASLKDDPVRGSFLAVCQRPIPPEEMAMILRINKGASGRYKLVRDNKQISVLQRALFVRNFPDIWRARAKALFEADKVKKERASVSASPAATTSANSTLLTSLEQSAKAFFQAHKLREDEASVSDSFDATTSATSTSVPSSTITMTSTENLDEENKLKKEEASACDSSAATTSTTSTRVPSSTITTTSTNNLDEADKLKEEEASDSDSSA